MSDNWGFYQCLIDDQPASIMVNMGLIARAPIPGFEAFGYVRVYLKAPHPNGLPTDDEFPVLSEIDASLPAGIRGHYAGRATADGARTYYFYIARADEFERDAASAMRAFSSYEFDQGNRDDPDWEVYRKFLYPSSLNRHFMRNRGVLEALDERGDDGVEVRPIDHWAYFKRHDDALKFAGHAEAEGFAVSDRGVLVTGKYLVRLNRVDRPIGIDDLTISLHGKASEMGGEYDGWECPVVTP